MGNEVWDIGSKEELKYAMDSIFALAKEKSEFLPQLILAVETLKKQMPIAPIGKFTDYRCAVCARRVRSGKGSSSHIRDNFCQRCGQRLDWGEANER